MSSVEMKSTAAALRGRPVLTARANGPYVAYSWNDIWFIAEDGGLANVIAGLTLTLVKGAGATSVANATCTLLTNGRAGTFDMTLHLLPPNHVGVIEILKFGSVRPDCLRPVAVNLSTSFTTANYPAIGSAEFPAMSQTRIEVC